MKYTYIDNKDGKYTNGKWTGEILFSCSAQSISEADEKFEQEIGIHPEKMKYVGCFIEKE